MKKIGILLGIVIAMCYLIPANGQSQQEQKFQNFYFSQKHFDHVLKIREYREILIPVSGNNPYRRPTLSTVNGKYFTCQCDSVYFETEYKVQFPDAVLVARLPEGEGAFHNYY